MWAVCELLVGLQRRSHLVIVEGMDDPATRQTLLAMVDARVLVAEPTTAGAACAARTMARLGPMLDQDWPLVLVENHTRAFRAGAGTRAFRRAGVAVAPDVAVPFEPALPAVSDRGWPPGRLPRSLRDPLDRLVDALLASEVNDRTVAIPSHSPAAQETSRRVPASSGRPRSQPEPAGRRLPAALPASLRAGLRRILPLRSARPRAA